jgi:hypothetical protein
MANPAPGNGTGSARGNGSAAKPNILVIWGDGIGITNLSCWSHP